MELQNKLEEIQKLMKKPDTRITIYNSKMIDQLIELVSKDKNIEDTLEKLVQNISELEMVAQTNAFYLVCQILKDAEKYDQKVIYQDLQTLQSFVQSEDTCYVLIKYHKLLNLLSSLPQKCDQTEQLVQKLAGVIYTMMLCYPKCISKISSFGFGGFFIKILSEYQNIENDKQNMTLYLSLLVMERFSQKKEQIQYFLSQKFDIICQDLLDQYIKQVDSNNIIFTDDIINVLLNIICSFVIQDSNLSVQFINKGILLKLRNLIINSDISLQVQRFLVSCFIEIFYANKGHHFCNAQDMLRSLKDDCIDTSLKLFVQQIDQQRDNELTILYSQLIKMICSVPKKDDFIRQILLQDGMLRIFIDQLTYDKYTIECYQQILEAMSQLLCAQKLDKDTLMTDIPQLIGVVKRIKREWSQKQYKKDPYYQNAIESARKVLEKVGDSEGRDTRKARQISYIIVCVSVIIGASISLLIK